MENKQSEIYWDIYEIVESDKELIAILIERNSGDIKRVTYRKEV